MIRNCSHPAYQWVHQVWEEDKRPQLGLSKVLNLKNPLRNKLLSSLKNHLLVFSSKIEFKLSHSLLNRNRLSNQFPDRWLWWHPCKLSQFLCHQFKVRSPWSSSHHNSRIWGIQDSKSNRYHSNQPRYMITHHNRLIKRLITPSQFLHWSQLWKKELCPSQT